jgi:Ca2+-binding RTX toxin-like protein
MRRRRRIGLVLALSILIVSACGALAQVASAGEASTVVSGDKRWVTYDAAPSEENRLLIQVSLGSTLVRLADTGADISAGPGCVLDPQGRALCRIPDRVVLVQARLGGGDDRGAAITSNTQAAQVNITGGRGDDVLRGQGPTRFNFSGDDGNDNLVGGDGRDILRGRAGRDLMSGRAGRDLLIGDSGGDVLRAGLGRDRLFGGPDTDKLDARDDPAAVDSVVSCGTGRDRTTADRIDRPKITGCEFIKT